ncbi:unnamed protein product, partial [Arabidopsis halleri]
MVNVYNIRHYQLLFASGKACDLCLLISIKPLIEYI